MHQPYFVKKEHLLILCLLVLLTSQQKREPSKWCKNMLFNKIVLHSGTQHLFTSLFCAFNFIFFSCKVTPPCKVTPVYGIDLILLYWSILSQNTLVECQKPDYWRKTMCLTYLWFDMKNEQRINKGDAWSWSTWAWSSCITSTLGYCVLKVGKTEFFNFGSTGAISFGMDNFSWLTAYFGPVVLKVEKMFRL